MTQAFAAPVIQQPEKPKKNFCFAAIPFIIIALLNLYECIINSFDIPSNWYEVLDDTDYLYDIYSELGYLAFCILMFIGTVVLSILLFAKVYNAWLGVPLFMISAAFIMYISSDISYMFDLVYGKEIIFDTPSEALFENIPRFMILSTASVAFLVVTVYTFIVTARKKPAPKALWILPAALFSLFYAPWAILILIYFFESIYYMGFENLMYLPVYFTEPLLPVAVILLLIWLSFPYKKDKSQKIPQPAPAAAHVMPPVTPAVQPVAEKKTEEVDPERTIDYSYAEVFYPPVDKPADKPAADTVPKPEVSNDIEHLRNNTQFLKEYKALLDDGLITQEDYDKKKNELLNL